MRDSSEKTPKMFRLPKAHGFRNELEPATGRDPASETITRAFKLMSGEEADKPASGEYDKAVADIKKDTEIDSVQPELGKPEEAAELPAKEVSKTEETIAAEGLKFSMMPEPPKKIAEPKFEKLPEDESIEGEVKKYAETSAGGKETAGFTSAGDRIRVVIPDDPSDPDRVERVTRLGLSAIKSVETKRNKKK